MSRVDVSGIEWDSADPEAAKRRRDRERRMAGRQGHPGSFHNKIVTEGPLDDLSPSIEAYLEHYRKMEEQRKAVRSWWHNP